MSTKPKFIIPNRVLSTVLPVLALALVLLGIPPALYASDTPDPSSVTVAGSLQDELGCPGDWQPDCADTHLGFDAEDDVWQGFFNVPAGLWDYKAALNDSWTENYGEGGVRDGPNIGLDLGAATDVKFYYSHETHWITDNVNSVIATAAGSFQSEMGCSGDWQPWCLRSWLQDPDGDEIFVFETSKLPAGDYETKVAHDEDWAENYGDGGVPGGANIPFNVPADCADMSFEYELSSHILTVGEALPPAQPANVTIVGSLQQELGCPGDWQPDCAITHLGFDAEDQVWQGIFPVPAGSWEYKAALNDSWDENYGENATLNGANIGLSLGGPSDVKFYYSDETHWITDNQNATIATLSGSFQSELGCPGDWQPWCLRSWLQDPDGDGLYTFSTAKLPAGSYEVKVAHDEAWDESYPASNVLFTVPANCAEIFFTYDPVIHQLDIGTGPGAITAVDIDIKFCSNPNAFNCKKKGVLPVTIFGTAGLDVADIDISSLMLCTEDLVSCTNAPKDWSVADRGDPTSDIGAAMCAVFEVEEGIFEEQDYLTQDDYLDLDVAFEAREVQDMLGTFCSDVKGASSDPLIITGTTLDGTVIFSFPVPNIGTDQLWKVNK